MRGKRSIFLMLILFLILLMPGCKRYRVGDTYVWIDVPINNLVFPDPQPIQVEGHASAAEGLSKVEVYIDSDLFSTLSDLSVKGKLAYFQTTWTPTSPGEYTILAIAYDNSNQASEIDSVRIFFGVDPSDDMPVEALTTTSTITETDTTTALTLTSTLETPTININPSYTISNINFHTHARTPHIDPDNHANAARHHTTTCSITCCPG